MANGVPYKQTAPLQGSFADRMLAQEGLGFRYREEEQKAVEEQRKRNEALAAEAGIALSQLNDVISGVDTLDKINYMAVSKARDYVGDIYRKMAASPKMRQDPEIQMGLQNLLNLPELLSKAQKKIVDYNSIITKAYAEGKASNWDRDNVDKLAAFFGIKDEKGNITPNYIIEFNKDYSPYAIGRDEDGNLFKMNVLDVINGYEMSDMTPVFDAEKAARESGIKLGKRQNVSEEGRYVVTEQKFESQKADVEAAFRATLGTPKNPSVIAKSYWSDTLRKPKKELTQEDFDLIVSDYSNRVKTYYDEEKKYTQKYQPPGYYPSAGERMQTREAANLYELTNKIARGDADALASISNFTTTIDGKKVNWQGTITRDGDVFTDNEGNEKIVTNDMTEEQKAIIIGSIIRPKDTPDQLRALYEEGKRATGGDIGEIVPATPRERVMVYPYDLTPLRKLKGGKPENIASTITNLYGKGNKEVDVNDEFNATTSWGKIKIKHQASGKEKSFNTNDVEGMIKFMEETALNKVPRYVEPTNTVKPSEKAKGL